MTVTYEERAAIMELDGGLTRSEAEREARIIVGAQHAAPLPIPEQQELFHHVRRYANSP